MMTVLWLAWASLFLSVDSYQHLFSVTTEEGLQKMKTRIDVLAVERKESIYEHGRKSIKYVCQVVIRGDKIQVGEMVIPESYLPNGIEPGPYLVEYAPGISWQTKKVEGQLRTIEPASSVVGSRDDKKPSSVASAVAA